VETKSGPGKGGVSIKVPQLLWYDYKEAELTFPSTWNVSLCSMKGGERKALTEKEIENAFASPIGTPSIEELAKGKGQVVILFDDMARPTPISRIIHHVLAALERAGIPDGRVRFVAALGAHGAHTAGDFRKKLGEEVLERFPVYNHNAFASCAYLGKTTGGTPVSVNREVMSCDLKIGIGCITPHVFAGFGGGGKIILPGVAHIDSIAHNHGPVLQAHPECLGLGRMAGNMVRADMEDAARMAGLDMKIDAVLNQKGEIAGLFVGDFVEEHRAGVELAKEVYATVQAKDMDIVVVNAFAKSNECAIAPFIAMPSIKKEGGDLVIIANEPSGQVVHYLFGEFGKSNDGALLPPQPAPPNIKRCIILSPIKDIVGASMFKGLPPFIWVKEWEEVRNLLVTEWGEKADVAVYPDATVQYFPQA
jgi:nickel-dependent lactate racemase